MIARILTFSLIALWSAPAKPPASQPAEAQGIEVRAAAGGFLESLSGDQRDQAARPHDPGAIRLISLFPGNRVGVRTGDLGEPQRGRLKALLGTVLSKKGLERAQRVFKQGSGEEDYYYVQFHDGEEKDPLVWRLEGHHFSLTVFVNEKQEVRLGTVLIGGNPPDVWSDLGNRARAVYGSLVDAQKETARASQSPRRTGHRPFYPTLESGVEFGKLERDQQESVNKLLADYRSLFRPEILETAERAFEKRGGREKLRVAFAGDPVREDGEFYCGVTGAGLHVEFDNRQGHVHMLVNFSSDTLHDWREKESERK